MASGHAPHGDGLKSRINWAFAGFALIAGFFLLTEHRAHVLGLLPFVLVAFSAFLVALFTEMYGFPLIDQQGARR